jgi:hypothetical protein
MVWDSRAFTEHGVGRERPLAQRGVRRGCVWAQYGVGCRHVEAQHGSGADAPMPNVQHEVGHSHAPTQLKLSA